MTCTSRKSDNQINMKLTYSMFRVRTQSKTSVVLDVIMHVYLHVSCIMAVVFNKARF